LVVRILYAYLFLIIQLGDKMVVYKLKDSGYSPRSYTEPSVSYFDSLLEASEKTMVAMVGSATAVALALLSALTTSSRGSENPLEK
jgi:hypothetical protein